LQRLPDLARAAPVIPKVLRREILKWVVDPALNDALGVDIDHGRQHLRHRQDRWLGRGIGLGKETRRRQQKNRA
jgi:hypothetical protein